MAILSLVGRDVTSTSVRWLLVNLALSSIYLIYILVMFTKILVALDRSPEAETIFNYALSIARPQISEILLVHFIDWQVQNVSPWMGVGTLYDMDFSGDRYNWSREHLQQETEQANNWLEEYTKQAAERGIDCKFECRIGNCNLGIGDRAKAWGADLIVIGRRGHKNISEILLGSVSNYVIHHAPCSVFVVQGVRPEATEELATAKEVSRE